MLQQRVQQADSFYDASCDEALSRYCSRFGWNPWSRMTGWFCFTFNLPKWSSMQRSRKKIDCVLDASLRAELEKWFLFCWLFFYPIFSSLLYHFFSLFVVAFSCDFMILHHVWVSVFFLHLPSLKWSRCNCRRTANCDMMRTPRLDYFLFLLSCSFVQLRGVPKNSFQESGHALLAMSSSPMLASTVCRTPKIVLFFFQRP